MENDEIILLFIGWLLIVMGLISLFSEILFGLILIIIGFFIIRKIKEDESRGIWLEAKDYDRVDELISAKPKIKERFRNLLSKGL